MCVKMSVLDEVKRKERGRWARSLFWCGAAVVAVEEESCIFSTLDDLQMHRLECDVDILPYPLHHPQRQLAHKHDGWVCKCIPLPHLP